MSYYEVLLFLHVGAAVIWLGSALYDQALTYRASKTSDAALLRQLGVHSSWLAQRIFIPASLAVLVLGILLTIEGPWSFGDLWIVLGLAGYAASFVVGLLFLDPEARRITEAIERHGPESEQAGFHVRRISTVARMELAVLFLVVWMMTLKPSGDDTGTLLVAGAVLLAALAWGMPKLRAAAPETPAAATAD